MRAHACPDARTLCAFCPPIDVAFRTVALNYEPRSTAGKPPLPRGYHVAFLADSRLFLIGGFNGSDVYDDVHILDLAGAAYLPQVTSFTIDVE